MASLSSQSILSLQILVLFIASVCIHDSIGGAIESRSQREFDYFALALQWPGTYCQKTRHCCSSNACCRGSNAPTEFTIHGLWPDYNDGSWPSCCTRSSFDIEKISTLLNDIQKYWPTLSCGSTSTCHGGKGLFWAHEWEKHGTCAFPVFRDEYEYFFATLNLYFKYNVTKALSEEGYVPSNSEKYPLGGIISAIQIAFHATPSLFCSNGAVEELQICFSKDFKPRDCLIGSTTQTNVLSARSCPKYVSLPEYVYPGLKNGVAEFPWLPQHEAI